MSGEYNQVALDAQFKAINDRFRRLEDQIKKLSELAGVPYEDPNAELPEEVIQLATEGKKMEAVKAYRQATGAGMERAMEVVNGI